MLFIVRILEIFYVDKTLGPYVVMIGRMVSSTNRSIDVLRKIDFFQLWQYLYSTLTAKQMHFSDKDIFLTIIIPR